jgi:hypothetical protein
MESTEISDDMSMSMCLRFCPIVVEGVLRIDLAGCCCCLSIEDAGDEEGTGCVIAMRGVRETMADLFRVFGGNVGSKKACAPTRGVGGDRPEIDSGMIAEQNAISISNRHLGRLEISLRFT